MRRLGWALLATLWLGPVTAGPAVAADHDAVRADEQLLRSASVATDGTALLDYFRKRILNDKDRERISKLIQLLGADEFATREKASAELVTLGLPATSLLRQAIRDEVIEIARRAEQCLERIERLPGPTVSAAAARLLAVRNPDGAAEVLLAFLPFAEDERSVDEVRVALSAVAVRDGKPESVVLKALGDKQALRRGAAAEALVRAQASQALAAARTLLHQDPDPGVRFRLALAFVDHKDRQAVPVLIDSLAALPQTQAWQAEDVLCRLAGSDAPQISLGSDDDARQKCRDAWAGWWRKHGDKIDVAALNAAERLLGHTLIVVMDNRAVKGVARGGLGGRVYEITADGQTRWEIKDLVYPADARMLPGNRVLIAEYQNSRVTERNLKGEVIWEKRVALPVACQRLPNGNTFIACRNRLLEVDRTGKEVVAVPHPSDDIMAAQRLRNGQIVYIGANGTCTRIDPSGKELKSFSVGQIQTFAGIDLLPNGRLLVPLYANSKVVEYDAEGKAVWEANVRYPTSAVRLANGNTLVASMGTQQVLELDRTGKPVWQQKVDGRPWRARRR